VVVDNVGGNVLGGIVVTTGLLVGLNVDEYEY
jgi:hypothetical protein